MGSILTAAPPTCCYLLGGVVRGDVVLSALHRRPLRRRRAGPYRLCAENGPRRAARNGPHRLNARAVTLLSGSSVAPVYRFLLMLRNGEAADPPAFLTEQPDWQPGDVFVAANGRAFRIVDTNAEIEVAGMVLFDSIWTVEPLEESTGRLRHQ